MRRKTFFYILLILVAVVLLSRWGDLADLLSSDDLSPSGVVNTLTGEADEQTKTVTIWSNSGSPDVELRAAADFEQFMREQRHESVDIEMHFIQSGRTQDTIFVSFLSGSPPDLMNVTVGDMREFVAAGMLRPMDDLLIEQLIEDLISSGKLTEPRAAEIRASDRALPQLLEMGPEFIQDRIGRERSLMYFQANPNDPLLARDEDGDFHYPLQAARLLHMHGRFVGFVSGATSYQTLTYNKRVFRNAARMFPDAGLVDDDGDPIPPRNWAELLEKAKLIREYGRRSGEGTYGIVLQGRTPKDLMRGIEPLAAAAGTRGFDFTGDAWIEGQEPAGRYEYDAPGFIAAFRLLMLLKANDAVLPGTSSRHFEEARTALGEGKAGMLIDGWHAALIAVERVPWSTTDIASAPVPPPYQPMADMPVEQQRQKLHELIGMDVPYVGIPWQGDPSGTETITTGSRHPEIVWQWMHRNYKNPEQERKGTLRGTIPGTLSAAEKLDDPTWFPYPYQKQAWQTFETYGLWPQPPTTAPVLTQDYKEVLHEAFFVEDIEPGQLDKLDQISERVAAKLATYTEAVNANLAERVAEGRELPAQWTFGEQWDPADPDVAYDLQRLAAENPALNARIQELKSHLPSQYQFSSRQQVIDFFEGFRTSASPFNILWPPALLIAAALVYVLMLLGRRTPTGEPALKAAATQARRAWYAYVFVLPAMLMLFAFVIYPSLYQLYLAFHQGSGIAPLQFVGFEQFAKIFRDQAFWSKVLPNTALYMIVVTAFQIGVGLVVASLLNLPLRMNHLIRPLFFVPLAVSLAAVSIVFLGLLGGPDSTINAVLDSVGLGGLPYWLGFSDDPLKPHDWLGDPSTDLYMVMLVGIWHGLPYNIILLLAGLQSIDPQLYEAGKVDGAGPSQRFFHITIPELMPILIVITFNALIGAARAFGPVWILTEGGKNRSSEVVATYIYKWGFTKPPDQQPDIGYASALGIMYSVILGLLIFANVYIVAKRWRQKLANEQKANEPSDEPNTAQPTAAGGAA